MNEQIPTQYPESDASPKIGKRLQEEEVELWWGSYAPRAVLPDFGLSLVLTVMVIGFASYLGAWHEEVIVRGSIRALIITFWIIQVAKWCYRLTAISYRLTTRRLLSTREFSLRAPPEHGLLLAHVNQVLVEQSFLERLLKLGRIQIRNFDSSQPELVLRGIHQPLKVAAMIRRQARRFTQPPAKTP